MPYLEVWKLIMNHQSPHHLGITEYMLYLMETVKTRYIPASWLSIAFSDTYGYQVSLVVSGSSSRSDERGSNPAPTAGGHLRSRVW